MRLRLKPPNRDLMTELETPRFILRPVGPLEILRDPGDWRRTEWIYRDLYLQERPLSLVGWLKCGPFPDQFRRFTSAIVPRGESRAIGYHMVTLQRGNSASCTAGIHDAAWRGKDATVEARIRILNHYFRHGIERFTGKVEATNFASVFTYRKLGYTQVATVRGERHRPDGRPLDDLLFEMRKEDWMRGPHAEPDR